MGGFVLNLVAEGQAFPVARLPTDLANEATRISVLRTWHVGPRPVVKVHVYAVLAGARVRFAGIEVRVRLPNKKRA